MCFLKSSGHVTVQFSYEFTLELRDNLTEATFNCVHSSFLICKQAATVSVPRCISLIDLKQANNLL